MSITQQLRKNSVTSSHPPPQLQHQNQQKPIRYNTNKNLEMNLNQPNNRMHIDMLEQLNKGTLSFTRNEEDDQFSQILKKQQQSISTGTLDQKPPTQPLANKAALLKHQTYNQDQTLASATHSTKLTKPSANITQEQTMSFSLPYQQVIPSKQLKMPTSLQIRNIKNEKEDNQFLPFQPNNPPSTAQIPFPRCTFFEKPKSNEQIESAMPQIPSSASPSSRFFSPQFGLSSGSSRMNNLLLQSSLQRKKGVKELKRKLFCSDVYEEDDSAASNMTLKQYSEFQFSINPFITKHEYKKYHQQQSLDNPKPFSLPLDECFEYKFVCRPCLEQLNDSSSDETNRSIANYASTISAAAMSTAKKSKSQENCNNQIKNKQQNKIENENEISTTSKKLNPSITTAFKSPSLYEQTISPQRRLPCFCCRGVVGFEEFCARLTQIHSQQLVRKEELKQHFKYIIWKQSASKSLSIESVYFELEFRIYITTFKQFKSSFTCFMSNDQKSSHQQQLTASFVLLIASITEEEHSYSIELTDTWTSAFLTIKKTPFLASPINVFQQQNLKNQAPKPRLKMSNDELFAEIIKNKSIYPRIKVRVTQIHKIQDISVSNSKNNQQNQSSHIKRKYPSIEIPFNCFQREIQQNQRIGLIQQQSPFLRTLASIKPNGGPIPLIDVIILKKYPLLVQYFEREKKKIVTYANAVSEDVVRGVGEYFFARFIVHDSICVYDRTIALSTLPRTEVIIEFQSHSQYSSLIEGERIRISSTKCEFVENTTTSSNQLIHKMVSCTSIYKLTLRAQFTNIVTQHSFLKKADLPRSQAFYQSIGKNLIKSKSIDDLVSILTQIEAEPIGTQASSIFQKIEFDVIGTFLSISHNQQLIVLEIKLFNNKESYRCEIKAHHPFLLEKFLKLPTKHQTQCFNTIFKWISKDKRIIRFSTSFHSFVHIFN